MTEDQMRAVARSNIELHLGDAAGEYESAEAAADALYDEAYTLGFDALHDVGVPDDQARRIAGEVASLLAQP